MPDVPASYGGLTLLQNNPNTLLIGGAANTGSGAIYSIGVTRTLIEGQNRISGFTGSATTFATAPNIDGGLAYGPDNVLFATTYSDNQLLQYKPGSTAPDKTIDLSALGISSSTGTVNFVPTGYAGAGQIRILSYSAHTVYTGTLTPDGAGTFNLTGTSLTDSLGQGGPEGIVWVPAGSPVFDPTKRFVLISEFQAGRVSAYEWQNDGTILVSSRQDFITGLTGAEGAMLDPLTNDFLFSTFGGGDQVIRISGFAPVPEPSSVLAVAVIAGLVVRTVRRAKRRKQPEASS